MFPPSSIVSQRHCRLFFLNPPFLSVRPSPHLTNWTFGARRHASGTTTDTCWIYLAFVRKVETQQVREHRASSVRSHANKRWAVSLSCEFKIKMGGGGASKFARSECECVRVRAPRVRLRVWIIALSLSCHLPWPISGQVIKCSSKYITAYILCRATKMSLWNQYGQSPICVNQNKTAHFTGLKNIHVFLPLEYHLKGAACFLKWLQFI